MCLSTRTVLFSLLILLVSLLSVFVEILFCKAEWPGPLSLTSGLLVRIWCFHYCDPAQSLLGNPGPTSSHCRLRPLEIITNISTASDFTFTARYNWVSFWFWPMYSSSSCSWRQLSCCSLSAEPRVGKAQAKRLERDVRRCRNCRNVSLLAGAAAVSQLSPLWLTQQTQPWHNSKCCCLSRWSLYVRTAHILWPNEHLVRLMCRDTHDLSCYIDVIYKTWGERAWTHRLAQFAVPHSPAVSFFLELLEIALCSSPGAYWRPSDLGAYLPVPNLFAFLSCPWGSPGKNIRVGCWFFLQWSMFS